MKTQHTIRARIGQGDFARYLDELEETRLPYCFVATSDKGVRPVTLGLMLDGEEHNGTEVTLFDTGVWHVTTRLVIRETV